MVKIILMTLGFILFDWITGSIKGIMKKEFNSKKLREGLFHKLAFILSIALCVMIDYAQGLVNLGFSVPLTVCINIYIIVTEITSIIENLKEINPTLKHSKFTSIFNRKEG